MTEQWWGEDPRRWSAGRWSLEVRGDELADISVDGVLVLRSVRAVVRDRDWATASLVVDDVAAHADRLELSVHSSGVGSSFTGTIAVTAEGARLDIACALTALRPFETNRTGLVVLHPPSLAGEPLRVVHASGSTEQTRFPARISPHQPVRDIASLAWRTEDLEIALAFLGDVFEMEDQRNWTDASFKTYSRPLDLPFPYRIEAGEQVSQRVRIDAAPRDGSRGDHARRSAVDVSTIVLRPGGVFPRIGLGAASAPDPAPAGGGAEASFVVVDVDLADPAWRAVLERACASGLPVDVRLVLDDADAAALSAAARALSGLDIARVTAFWASGPARHVSDEAAVRALRAALEAAGVTASVVGGTRAHFTELNREHHRLPTDLAGIVFSSTPLFHSSDTYQLVDAVAMQRHTAREAVDLSGGLPVHIGPVTLRPRFNDVATTPPPRSGRTDLRAGYGAQLADADDARQDSPQLAAWTIASAAAFAVPGVASLSFFEEWGPRGIRTAQGRDRPVAAAVRALVQTAGPDGDPARLWHGDSPDGLVWALGGSARAGATVLVANLDRVPRTVRLALPALQMTTVAAGGVAVVAIDHPLTEEPS